MGPRRGALATISDLVFTLWLVAVVAHWLGHDFLSGESAGILFACGLGLRVLSTLLGKAAGGAPPDGS
jgi:uncharacterized membrane protein YtjA (UPF0391 family)